MIYVVCDQDDNDIFYTQDEDEAKGLCQQHPKYFYDSYRADPLPGENLKDAVKRRDDELKAYYIAKTKSTANLINRHYEMFKAKQTQSTMR